MVKPESEHLSSISRARVSAFMSPLQPTPPRLDSHHAELQFWSFARHRAVMAHHRPRRGQSPPLHPRQFFCTTSSPWLPLRRAHDSHSSSAASSPLMRPCLRGLPFTSQRARGQPCSGHLRPSKLLGKVTGEWSLLSRYPYHLVVAVAHQNTVAIAVGCPLSWRRPSTTSRLMQPPPIMSR